MQRLIIGPVVLLILIVGGFVAYTYFVAKLPPTPKNVISTFTTTKEKVTTTSPRIQSSTADGNQLQTLSQRAGEVGQHAQKVLGESIQVNEQEKKPIHESAIDYGRYIYCQQVIKEYETDNPSKSGKTND